MPTRIEKRESPKQFRFDARISESQKLLIQRAADLEGCSLTNFVLRSAKTAADRTIQERTMIVMNARDSEVFVDSLLKPRESRRVLRNAARSYKKAASL